MAGKMIKTGDIFVHKDSGKWYAAHEDNSSPLFEKWVIVRQRDRKEPTNGNQEESPKAHDAQKEVLNHG